MMNRLAAYVFCCVPLLASLAPVLADKGALAEGGGTPTEKTLYLVGEEVSASANAWADAYVSAVSGDTWSLRFKVSASADNGIQQAGPSSVDESDADGVGQVGARSECPPGEMADREWCTWEDIGEHHSIVRWFASARAMINLVSAQDNTPAPYTEVPADYEVAPPEMPGGGEGLAVVVGEGETS